MMKSNLQEGGANGESLGESQSDDNGGDEDRCSRVVNRQEGMGSCSHATNVG